jgi:hypothetical protein
MSSFTLLHLLELIPLEFCRSGNYFCGCLSSVDEHSSNSILPALRFVLVVGEDGAEWVETSEWANHICAISSEAHDIPSVCSAIPPVQAKPHVFRTGPFRWLHIRRVRL